MTIEMRTQESAVLSGHADAVTALAVLPDGRLLSAAADHSVRLWEPASPSSPTHLYLGHTDAVRAVAVLPESRFASASSDTTICIWRTAPFVESAPEMVSTTSPVAVLSGVHTKAVWALAPLPRQRLASASYDGTVCIWNTFTGAAETVLRPKTKSSPSAVLSITVLRDGVTLVAGAADGSLRVWDINTGKCLRVIENAHTGAVRALTLMADGRVASAGFDKAVRVWDIVYGSGGCDQVLYGHSSFVFAVVGLPDGRLVSGGADRVVRVWNVESGSCEEEVGGHAKAVLCLAVGPNCHVVAGCADSSLKISKHAGSLTAVSALKKCMRQAARSNSMPDMVNLARMPAA